MSDVGDPGATTIELVRHEKALSRDRWTERPDPERPLTDRGLRASRLLADVLIDAGAIAAIHTSPYTRCRQTVEPLVERCGVEALDAPALAELRGLPVLDGKDPWVTSAWLGGRALDLLDRLVAAHPGDRVVLCSHGDVIPSVLAALAGRDAFAFPDVRVRKGGRVTLTFSGGRCVRAVPSGPVDD